MGGWVKEGSRIGVLDVLRTMPSLRLAACILHDERESRKTLVNGDALSA
jgi:hypothetical protein